MFLFWFGAAGNKRAMRPPLPPPGCGGEWKEKGRNWLVRIRAVYKGSLTEQQTKGTVTTRIQIRGIHKTNLQNRTALSDRMTTEPSRARECVPTPSSPPREPSMTAHGMEYPALFGQVGSAPPAVPLPGFW